MHVVPGQLAFTHKCKLSARVRLKKLFANYMNNYDKLIDYFYMEISNS